MAFQNFLTKFKTDRRYQIGGIVVLIIIFLIIANADKDNAPEPAAPTTNQATLDLWAKVRANDPVRLNSEWKNPTWLEVNSDLWEDGAYITGDGNTLYFVIYQGDLINDILAGKLEGELDVYLSQRPFTTKSKAPISEKTWAEGGVMISGKDTYYMSNKYAKDGKYDTDIYKNGARMSFNTAEDEDDPHYCAAKDELYFWKKDGGDSNIYVYADGEIKKLPAPINTAATDIQPFLTPDCQTMYFSSNRDGNQAIYRVQRTDEGWEKPTKVISGKIAVGEPTLTDDGKYLFFIQVFRNDDGAFTSDIMFVERK